MTSSRSSRNASRVLARRSRRGRRGTARPGGPRATSAARDRLGDAPRGRVDDGHPVVVGQEPEQRVEPFALASDAAPLRTTDWRGRTSRDARRTRAGRKPRARGDVLPHLGRGAAGERDGRRPPEAVARGAERAVARPEIVAPFGDAVGLVHREERGTEARSPQLRREPGEPLGRDVQQAEGSGLEAPRCRFRSDSETPLCSAAAGMPRATAAAT